MNENNTIETIEVCKAEPLGDGEVKSINLQIAQKLPSFNSMKHLESFYSTQAEMIANALYHSLPQGVRWRLLMLLMKAEARNITSAGR